MVDLQFIEIRDVLKVTGIEDIDFSDPVTILVRGRDFNSAQDVYINEVKSPDVVITSGTTLLAQVPETQIGLPITSLVATSNRLTRTDRSFIEFGLGNNPGAVDGFTRLIQLYLKIMLQSPGTDVFSPKIGGGLLAAVGKLVHVNGSSLVADFKRAADESRRQIMTLQSNNPRIGLDERLLYAQVVGVRYIPQTTTLSGRISIGNQAGNGAVVGMGL